MKPANFFTAFTALLLSACASPKTADPTTPATAASVSLDRYLGRWHEIARFPMRFQKADEAATADYGIRPDGRVSVLNTATRPDGTTRSIRGHATILNPPENTRLAVRFTNWFGFLIPVPKEGNYWILHVDADYRHAIVGTPDRRYLWILARTPAVSTGQFSNLRALAAERGFDVSRLITTQPSS